MRIAMCVYVTDVYKKTIIELLVEVEFILYLHCDWQHTSDKSNIFSTRLLLMNARLPVAQTRVWTQLFRNFPSYNGLCYYAIPAKFI